MIPNENLSQNNLFESILIFEIMLIENINLTSLSDDYKKHSLISYESIIPFTSVNSTIKLIRKSKKEINILFNEYIISIYMEEGKVAIKKEGKHEYLNDDTAIRHTLEFPDTFLFKRFCFYGEWSEVYIERLEHMIKNFNHTRKGQFYVEKI